MSSNTARIDAPLEDVWAVLADGWSYPLWVVGATRMRGVDPEWPQVGSRLHHSVGTWPVVIDDDTEVTDVVEGERLELRAHAWPGGSADVEIELVPDGDGTIVTLREDIAAGPSKLIPPFIRHPLLEWRNTESLRRLGFIAEGRHPDPNNSVVRTW